MLFSMVHIICLGINHTTASVDLRERLAFSSQRAEISLARLGCGNGMICKGIQEMVILSTCNRVEIYSVAATKNFDYLEAFLSEASGVSKHDFREHVYRLSNEEAITHLLRVACGLDSQVLGEPQILGQVTQALGLARSQGAAGKILSRLFQRAIHAGKRARTETVISQQPSSVASVAVNLISQLTPDLNSVHVMLLGAGEMAEIAVQSLIKRGLSGFHVVNRTLERAEALARRWDGQAAPFEAIGDLLPLMDVLICSTGAPHAIIFPDLVAPIMGKRSERPLMIMDIAVPRDVDPRVAGISGVSLFDMDALSANLEQSLALREAEVPRVEAIVAEEEQQFIDYLITLDVVPLIVEIRKRADAIRQAELEKTIRRLPQLSAQEQESIDALTKAIVSKILHNPTARLRLESGGPDAADYAQVTRGLFGLD
jgi:glutamyl-tRNA reductase